MRSVYPWVVALATIWAVAPLAYPGLFQTHSGLLPIYNLMDLHAHLSSCYGWLPIFGKTFDLWRNEGPLPYFAAELFHLLGLPFATAVKLVYALSLTGSGLAMYALVQRLLRSSDPPVRNSAGLLAALVYVYLPYHLAVVYIRGALAEAVSWLLFPLCLLAALHLIESRRWAAILLTTFSSAALFLTTPGLGLLFLLLTLLLAGPYLRWNYPSSVRHSLAILAGLFAAGLLLASLLQLPALVRSNLAVSSAGFTPAYVLPFQVLTATWGSAIPTGSFLDRFPFQLGTAAIALTLAAFAFATAEHNRNLRARGWLIGQLLTTLLLLALISPLAAPVWESAGLGVLLHAPWELLALANFGLALTAGLTVVFETRLTQPSLLAAFAALPLLVSYSYLSPTFIDLSPNRPPVAVFNNNELMLLDYKIIRPPGEVLHGATVQVEMDWQALRPVGRDYTVFFQAVDAAGKVWGQQDSKPQDGASPTLKWTPGQVISDTHVLQVDLTGPREGYTLVLGLYNAPTGERAVTASGDTQVELVQAR